MDVKSAFLNGNLKETVYMNQPDGFKEGNKVCKLNKTLYGLKQASRGWNERFNDFIIQLGFNRSQSDPCIYTFHSNIYIIYVIIYVDDILIICNDLKEIRRLKQKFSSEFEMKDLNELEFFLGMKIERDISDSILKISQLKYIEKIIKNFNMEHCKPISTPMEPGLDLSKIEEKENTNKPYRELIGSLMYLMLCTRPDISYAVGYLSRFQSCSTDAHWEYLKRILRYLQLTKEMKLVFGNNKNDEIIGYVDSDWASDKTDRKSTTGYVLKLYGSTILWGSKKQNCVSLSSTEAEYIALSYALCEYLSLKNLLHDLDQHFQPLVMYEDNQAVIRLASEFGQFARLKHIDIRYNFAKELIQKDAIKLKYIPTTDQQADIMTKALGRNQFEKLRNHLGLLY